MDPLLVLLLALLIGVVAGLRSLTAPAAVAWAAHLQWLDLRHTSVALMVNTAPRGHTVRPRSFPFRGDNPLLIKE